VFVRGHIGAVFSYEQNRRDDFIRQQRERDNRQYGHDRLFLDDIVSLLALSASGRYVYYIHNRISESNVAFY